MEKVFNKELEEEFVNSPIDFRPLNDVLFDLTMERLGIVDDRKEHKDHWWTLQFSEGYIDYQGNIVDYPMSHAYCFTCKKWLKYPSETGVFRIKMEAEKEWNIKIL